MEGKDVLEFIITLPVPLLMIVGGLLMKKKPPKKINLWVGYRFARARKSQEAWDFAQSVSGRNLFITGIPLLVVTTLLYWLLPEPQKTLHIILVIVQVAVLAAGLVHVNVLLKRQFDDKGRPMA